MVFNDAMKLRVAGVLLSGHCYVIAKVFKCCLVHCYVVTLVLLVAARELLGCSEWLQDHCYAVDKVFNCV